MTLIPFVPAAGYGNTVSGDYGSATAAHSWPMTLLVAAADAAGYGNTVSSDYGAATAAQAWPMTLLVDVGAAGYGNNVSAGYDDGSLLGVTVVWYDIEATVGGTPGTMTLHPEGMVPGTPIGAYRLREWRGPVAAKLNAGPGAVVQASTVGADLRVTFTLPVGDYVAYAPAYPKRRLFFKVTS